MSTSVDRNSSFAEMIDWHLKCPVNRAVNGVIVVTIIVKGSAVIVARNVAHLCNVRNYRAATKTKLNR